MQTWACITLARELFKRSGFVTVEIGPSSVDHKSQWCNKSRQKFARLEKEKFCDKSRPDWSLISSFPHRGDRSSERPHLARIAWQIHARAGFIANLMTSANCFIRNFQNSSWTIEKCFSLLSFLCTKLANYFDISWPAITMTAHAAKMKGLLTTAAHFVHESNEMHLNCKFNRRQGPTFTPNGVDAYSCWSWGLHSFEPT